MKIIIDVDNSLIRNDDLDLFINEFRHSLKTGACSGEYKSEFLNFKWESQGWE